MRRSSPAPTSFTTRLKLEVLEGRDVPSAFAPEDPGESAWIEKQFTDMQRGVGLFKNEWIVKPTSGQNSVTLAQSVGAQESGFVRLLGVPEWQFVSGIDSKSQWTALQSAQAQGKIDNFYPVIYRDLVRKFVPDDPLYGNQWHLRNTGQTGGTAGIDANIEGAWQLATGKGVVVQIIDDGAQYLHPDLRNNLFINPTDPGNPYNVKTNVDRRDNDDDGYVDNYIGWDFIDDDNDPESDLSSDFHGHAVAGVIVAQGGNGIGVTGAAPDAQFFPVRLIGGPASDAAVAEAFMMLSKYTWVSNNSWGPYGYQDLATVGPVVKRAIREAALYGRDGKGTVIVIAGGNERTNGDYINYTDYGNSRYAIQVGALSHDGTFSYYSSPGASLFVSAPSNPAGPNVDTTKLGITTTDLVGTDGYNDGTELPGFPDYTNSFGGTSSAAPLVSGVIALMLEVNPNLTYRDVQAILAETATQSHDPGRYVANGADYLVSPDYGFGMIDATAAVQRAQTWVNLGPEVTTSSGVVTVDETIPDFDLGISTSPRPLTQSVEFFSNTRIEWLSLTLNATIPSRGDLRVTVTSPSGLTVTMALPRTTDTNPDYNGFTFSTPFFWGELARGKWTVTLSDEINSTSGLRVNEGTWDSFTLDFYGSESADVLPVSPPVVVPNLPNPTPGLGDFSDGDTGKLDPRNILPRTPAIIMSVPFSGVVQIIDPATGTARFTIQPFGADYRGELSVAQADVNGDGFMDVLIGAGPGAGPHVKIYNGATGAEIASFFAYDDSFTGGVNVAGGDVNADGFADIMVAAGPGGGPHIRTFSGRDFSDLGSFMAYDPNFRGGSTIASGDVNGDGRFDYFVGAGFGGGPHVYIIDGISKAVISTFFAYDSSFRNGVNVAAGDVTGDGLADLITGPGFGGGPDVRAFDIAAGSQNVRGFFAYDPATYAAGVRVVARDLNGDRIADIVTAPATGSDNIRQFNGVDTTLLTEFPSNSIVGVFVG